MDSASIKNICVFCGSQSGRRDDYSASAIALGKVLASKNIGLVYGGGSTGLMGEIATAVLDHGGYVAGVIPQALLQRELAHKGLQRLEVVSDMHERKALMAKLSDAFIAMPGGFGTLEELFEVITWNQLNFHDKPIGLLNSAGFYDRLVEFIAYQSGEGFISSTHAGMVVAESEPERLLQRLVATAKE